MVTEETSRNTTKSAAISASDGIVISPKGRQSLPSPRAEEVAAAQAVEAAEAAQAAAAETAQSAQAAQAAFLSNKEKPCTCRNDILTSQVVSLSNKERPCTCRNDILTTQVVSLSNKEAQPAPTIGSLVKTAFVYISYFALVIGALIVESYNVSGRPECKKVKVTGATSFGILGFILLDGIGYGLCEIWRSAHQKVGERWLRCIAVFFIICILLLLAVLVACVYILASIKC